MTRLTIFLLLVFVLVPCIIPGTTEAARAEQQLTAAQKELIGYLRLPDVHVNYTFDYRPQYFDELQWGDRTERVSRLRKQLGDMDEKADPVAFADVNKELSEVLRYDHREQEAKAYRETAARIYRQALAKSPQSGKALYGAGWAKSLSGADADRNAARDLYAEAVKADQAFCAPYLEMIDLHSEPALLEQADNCFRKAASRKDATAEDQYQYHVFLFQRDWFDFMTRMPGAFGAAIATGDDSPNPMLRLLDMISSDRSMAPLRRAAALDPQNVKYQVSLGAQQAIRLFKEHMKLMMTMMSANPTLPFEEAFRTAAKKTAETHKDLVREVTERFMIVEKQAPNTYPALYELWAIPLVLESKYEQAEQKLLKAIELDPTEGRRYQTLFVLYRVGWTEDSPAEKDRYSRLAGVLEKKCSSKCTAAERSMIAHIQFNEDRYAEAEKQLRAACDADTGGLSARTGLAVVLLKQHRFQESIDMVIAGRPLLKKASNDEKVHFCSLSAVLMLLTGDKDGALLWLEEAFKLDRNDAVSRNIYRAAMRPVEQQRKKH